MRLGDAPDSGNFEDRTGQSGGGFGMGGLGGGAIGLILQLVLSRFGIVGVLILVLGYCALSSLGGLGGGSSSTSTGESPLTRSRDPTRCILRAKRHLLGVLKNNPSLWLS